MNKVIGIFKNISKYNNSNMINELIALGINKEDITQTSQSISIIDNKIKQNKKSYSDNNKKFIDMVVRTGTIGGIIGFLIGLALVFIVSSTGKLLMLESSITIFTTFFSAIIFSFIIGMMYSLLKGEEGKNTICIVYSNYNNEKEVKNIFKKYDCIYINSYINENT